MPPHTEPISFTTSDSVTLRGLLLTPSPSLSHSQKLPCVILTQGFTLTIHQSLLSIATHICNSLAISCLLYDHRGLGNSDTTPNGIRSEIIPSQQILDLRDAITFAQTLPSIDANRIALWGYSYSGAHSLHLAACDRRVKAVIANGPLIDGWEQSHRLIPAPGWAGMFELFEKDRIARMKGDRPMMLPVVSQDPSAPCALPGTEAWEYFLGWHPETNGESRWRNEVTLRSLEEIPSFTSARASLEHIAPTPVLIGVGTRDVSNPPDLQLRFCRKLSEPKEIVVVEGGHFDLVKEGSKAREILGRSEVEFLRRWICPGMPEKES